MGRRAREHRAYKNTLEQAVFAEQCGWDAFWTVEHHFLEEYSHCSNPEVLYGAIAARTERMRLGYGVRLMPKPYNHPVRTAESVAVLDLLSDGRVDFGTGRSSTRAELEGFGIDPRETRAMWQEAIEHVVGCWTNDEYEFEGKHWSMPKRRVLPKPLQKPHPPIWGATSSEDGHRADRRARPRAVLVRGRRAARRGEEEDRHLPRRASRGARSRSASACTTRRPPSRWRCARRRAKRRGTRRANLRVVPEGGRAADRHRWRSWMAETKTGARQLRLRRGPREASTSAGALDLLTLEYLAEPGACVLGTPDECIEACRRYEAAGVDLLLCLVNPYKIPHDKVMQTIELMGAHVIPKFR